jgi:hypothetical protein
MNSKAGFFRKGSDRVMQATKVQRNGQTILEIDKKDEYTYPVHGWYYFETKEAAEAFFKTKMSQDN